MTDFSLLTCARLHLVCLNPPLYYNDCKLAFRSASYICMRPSYIFSFSIIRYTQIVRHNTVEWICPSLLLFHHDLHIVTRWSLYSMFGFDWRWYLACTVHPEHMWLGHLQWPLSCLINLDIDWNCAVQGPEACGNTSGHQQGAFVCVCVCVCACVCLFERYIGNNLQ